MFEANDFDTIMARILNRIDARFDKREGSLLYTLAAPIAMELAAAYVDMDSLLDETFAASASYDYLVKRAYDRGIIPISGIASILQITCTPATVEIPDGQEFTIGDLTFTVTGNEGNGVFEITCNETGTAGNLTSGEVIPVDDVEGLETVTLSGTLRVGTDDESQESLYARYLATFSAEDCAGNAIWYKNKIENYSGIFSCIATSHESADHPGMVLCKVIPADGSGEPLIWHNDEEKADIEAFLLEIQNDLDPDVSGRGLKQIPFGQELYVSLSLMTPIIPSLTLTVSADCSEQEEEAIEEEAAKIAKSYFRNEIQGRYKAEATPFTLRLDSFNAGLEKLLISIDGILHAEASLKIKDSTAQYDYISYYDFPCISYIMWSIEREG